MFNLPNKSTPSSQPRHEKRKKPNACLLSSLGVRLASLILISFIYGCSGDPGVSANNDAKVPDTEGVGIALPAGIRAKTLPAEGSLRAYVSVDSGSRREMQISNGQARLSVQGLSIGQHSFAIVYEFDSSNFGDGIPLAAATQTLNINAGSNRLVFDDSNYDLSFDDDQDSLSNIDELDAGGDPRTANALLAIRSAVPEAISSSADALPDGTLRAYIMVDSGSRQEMPIVDNQASLSINTLLPGERGFDIVFEFDSASFGNSIPLATASQTATLMIGPNALTFMNDFDVSADSDADGVANLDELVAGNNPLNANAALALTTTIPSETRVRDLPPEGTLNAFLSIDSAMRLPMIIDGTEISLSVDGLMPGERSFEITLEFDSPTFGDSILLGTLNTTVDLVAGLNPIALSSEGYNFSANDDSDGLSNIEELLAGRDPRTKEDSQAPSVVITFPPTQSLSDGETLTVRGTAADSLSEITSLTVNGIDASSADNFATWSASVPLARGTNTLVVAATDSELNSDPAAAQVIIEKKNLLISPQDIVIDEANSRALLVDQTLDAVISLDLASGEPTIVSDRTRPNSNVPLDSPQGIELDLANNRALVLESFDGGIIAVDLTSGERTVVSSNTFPNANNPQFLESNNIAFNEDSNQLLVAEGLGSGSIIAVDTDTGLRSVLSDGSTPNSSAPVLLFPGDIALDSQNNRVVVTDRDIFNPEGDIGSVVAIDLTSGVRRLLSNNTTPNAINPFGSTSGIVIDQANNRALVSDSASKAVVAVNLVTGSRLIVSDDDSRLLNRPSKLVVDGANNRALIVDDGLLAMDLSSGLITSVLDNSTPNRENKFNRAAGLALDNQNNRLLLVNSFRADSIISIDLDTGGRSIFSNNMFPNSNLPFGRLESITVDTENNRALVIDSSYPAVIAVNLSTGARTILSNNTTPSAANPLSFSSTGISVDSQNNRALVINGTANEMLAVDLNSGARTVVSNSATPNSNEEFQNPFDTAIDTLNGRALVTDSGVEGVIAVNLSTGARFLFSGFFLPDLENPFSNFLGGIAIDARNGRVLVVDQGQDAVVAVDLADGARTILSSKTIPDTNNALIDPIFIVVDTDNNRALLSDGSRVVAVDLVDGQRVILSQ